MRFYLVDQILFAYYSLLRVIEVCSVISLNNYLVITKLSHLLIDIAQYIVSFNTCILIKMCINIYIYR